MVAESRRASSRGIRASQAVSTLVADDDDFGGVMPASVVEIPSGVGECITASGSPVVREHGGVFAVPPQK